MAQIKRGILGGLKGKIANVVGSSWKGRAVLKSLPLSVANPKTPKQVAQRGKMSKCVRLAKVFVGNIISTMFNPFSGNITGYNLFVRENVANFSSDFPANRRSIKTAVGTVPVPANFTPTEPVAGTSEIAPSWDPTFDESLQLRDDVVHMTVFDANYNVLGTGSATREQEEETITLSRILVLAEKIYIGVAIIRADGSNAGSDGVYETTVVSE